MTETTDGINVRASSYYILWTFVPCRNCAEITQVFTLGVPPTHESFTPDDEALNPEIALDDAESGEWEKQDCPAVLHYLHYLPLSVRIRVHEMSHHFRAKPKDDLDGEYWSNHCEHCGVEQSDFDLFEEFDTPFNPAYPEGAAAIDFVEIREPFEANAAGYSVEFVDFEYMRLVAVIGNTE